MRIVGIIIMKFLYIASAAILAIQVGCSQKIDTVKSHVPFSVFSLSKTNYEWEEFVYPHNSEVVVINSYEDFDNYIKTTDKNNITTIPIDFSLQSLILARGVEPYACHTEILDLQYIPDKGYVMIMNMSTSLATVITNWNVALLTSKIHDGEKVSLVIDN